MKYLIKIKGFFSTDSVQSMMRLCTFVLVISGILITATAVVFQLDGGYYGIELVTIGILGKGYQKNIENKNMP